MNRFYDLPEELINLIYKKFHSKYVLQELLTRPGSFKNWFEDYKCWYCGKSMLEENEKSYRIINSLGPESWEYFRTKTINPDDDICLKIKDRFKDNFDSRCWSRFFTEQLKVMEFIAVHGWEFYKKNSIARQEYLRYCYFP